MGTNFIRNPVDLKNDLRRPFFSFHTTWTQRGRSLKINLWNFVFRFGCKYGLYLSVIDKLDSALGMESTLQKRESIVHHSINGSFAYRKRDYKAIFCPGSGGWSFPKPDSDTIKNLPPFQLYNLTTDIGEENNLYIEEPGLLEQYRIELASIVSNGRSTKGAIKKNDGDETWPQLSWMIDKE